MPRFAISIEREFCAAHSIVLNGEPEPLHGHNWCLRAVIEAPKLNDEGLVCDFHEVEVALDAIIEPFRNRTLNQTPPFHITSPTAEHVALHIASALNKRLTAPARVTSVEVTEAPGCKAIVHLDPDD